MEFKQISNPSGDLAGIWSWRRYQRLLGYALSNRKGWLAIIAVTLFSSVFAVLQPWPMKVLIDHVLGADPTPDWLATCLRWLPWSDSTQGLLAWAALAGIGIFVINSATEVILTFLWIYVGQRMTYSLAADLFSRLQRRSLIFHTRNSVGDLLLRTTSDSWCIYKIVDAVLFGPVRAVILLGGMAVVMWRADPVLTLVALAVLPLMVGLSMLFGRSMRATARTRRDLDGRIQAHVHQMLLGLPVVQAFAHEQRQQDHFRQLADRAIDAHRRSTWLGSLSGLTSGLATVAGSAVVLWIGAGRVLDGRLSLGDLLVFQMYLTALQTQFKASSGFYATLQEQKASVDRVLEILLSDPDVPESRSAVPLVAVRGHLRLEDVSFGFEPGRSVLSHVSLEVRPGETLAIVGETGSGKSTLAALVPRFFDPWSGTISIDGQDVREATLHSLRHQIAVVLQEPLLFPITIAENIAYGRPGASRAEIESAAMAANAHQFILRLPDGYDTVLTERAATLSVGERQRLAIARAILKDAPILILDEPTSALDVRTESAVLDALERLMSGKTTMLIAHRFAAIRRVDRILVLDHGKIVEEGNHNELLRAGGKYCQLYRCHQAAGHRRDLAGIEAGSSRG